MSLDPPFTAEFADAGFLAEVPQEARAQLEEQGTFQGAMDAATWNDKLVVFPFWSNTQVLWYRKSFVEKAGIDMSQPVTWDQIIDAADENDAKIGVQANKYEGYVVWINALVEGAGGHILEKADEGVDAEITISDDAGKTAAEIIEKLATSEAAPADLSVSNEGTAASTFGSDQGSFLLNWTYIWHNYDETAPDVAKDIGYTRYPQSVEGEDSRPPYGGIGIGVSAFSDSKELALEAAQCLVGPEMQGINADLTGNMPASTEGYQYEALQKNFPADLLQLFQDSVDAAAPRTVTPYWSDVSGSIQNIWHPPRSVDQDTPERSSTFIEDVLKGGDLL
jgi:multiple sugar transport system substrate-binding protein